LAYPTRVIAAPEAAAIDAEVVAQSSPVDPSNQVSTQDPVDADTTTKGPVATLSPVSTPPNELGPNANEKQPTVKTELERTRVEIPAKENPSRATESGYDISGYVQAQLEFHQDSEAQLRQGGTLLNQNRFLIRRGRVRIAREWDWASVVIEFDGNTSKGTSARLQKGEVSVVYHRSKTKGVPPLLQLTAGMFDLPFGFEMTDSAKTRWFMERSIISRALFPGEPDVGMKLHGGVAFLRYSVAVTNGEPLDEKSGYGLQDPNENKDVTVRFGVDTEMNPRWRISGGVSYNVGKGFHAGTDATKGTIKGQDTNGDGKPENTIVTADAAATPSENFSRWAVGADLQIRLKTWLGSTVLYGEVVTAQNLDRGLIIADPTIGKKTNVREFGGYIGFSQELTKYFVCGVRGDYYDPNSDWLDERAGKQVPTSQRVFGISPMVGVVLPERARIVLQWDVQDNRFARDERGVPSRLKNNVFTARFQVNL
jgi:hypothetical protein